MSQAAATAAVAASEFVLAAAIPAAQHKKSSAQMALANPQFAAVHERKLPDGAD